MSENASDVRESRDGMARRGRGSQGGESARYQSDGTGARDVNTRREYVIKK